jgi:hypothetical protein
VIPWVAVSFARVTQSHDAATGLVTPTSTTIAGRALQVRGQPRRYEALGLRLDTMPTLLFEPTSLALRANTSAFVQPGDTVTWNSATLTVRDVDVVAPDGLVQLARIVVGA